MGRLSDYINSHGRPSRAYSNASTRSAGGVVEIDGAGRVEQLFDQLLTTDPTMDILLRKLIKKAMSEVRNKTSKDISRYLKNDPRKAAKAVKHMAYKTLFGGNVSILQKRAGRVGATIDYSPQRKLVPGQRGGNRIKRSSDARNRLDKYFGSDRGFALRFQNSGTVERRSRWGNRGAIATRDMFGRIAPWHMEQALEEISEAITEYINKQANG
jgi:hypothetical protein